MENGIITLFISRAATWGSGSLAEEVEEILYGNNDRIKMEFDTLEEAEEYQKSLDKTKYASYIGIVLRTR